MNAVSDPDKLALEIAALTLTMPVISRERFAQLTGVSEGVVKGWIVRGYLPTYEIGKYRMINLTLLNKMALNKAPWL